MKTLKTKQNDNDLHISLLKCNGPSAERYYIRYKTTLLRKDMNSVYSTVLRTTTCRPSAEAANRLAVSVKHNTR